MDRDQRTKDLLRVGKEADAPRRKVGHQIRSGTEETGSARVPGVVSDAAEEAARAGAGGSAAESAVAEEPDFRPATDRIS